MSTDNVPVPVHITGGPTLMEWVTGLSAVSTVLLAGAALYFAWKAGQDLTHDRRDTFEIQIFREMLTILDRPSIGWPPPWLTELGTLRRMVKGPLYAIDTFLQEAPSLGVPADELSDARGVATQEHRADLKESARAELYEEIDIRTGNRRRHVSAKPQ